jgi:hypothetical protein
MMLDINNKKTFFLVINGLIALVGVWIIFYATNWGVWGYSDSATYLGAARSLAAGKGFEIQKSSGGIYLYRLFPPFYPMALSAVSFIAGNIFITARAVNLIVFGGFLFATGYLLFQGTEDIMLSFMGPAILLVSPMMIENFTGAMTEPIFFYVFALFLIFDYRYLYSPSPVNEVLLILFLSLLPITRYVGIIFIFSNLIILIVFLPLAVKKRFASALRISALSTLPITGWLLYIYQNTNQIAGRRTQLPKAFWDTFSEGFVIIPGLFKDFLPYAGLYENVIPSNVRFSILLVLFVILVSSAIILLIKNFQPEDKNNNKENMLFLVVMHSFSFLLFIPISYSITERSYVIDHRILSPLIPMVILISLLSYAVVISRLKINKVYPLIAASIVGIFLFRYYFFQARTEIVYLHENGRGFASKEYIQSGIISEIQKIPSNTIMISNSAGFILFHDNRLPQQVDQFHRRMYGTGNSASERNFRTQNAALILLLPDFNNFYGDQAKDLLPVLSDGLVVEYQDSVSAIYYFPSQ